MAITLPKHTFSKAPHPCVLHYMLPLRCGWVDAGWYSGAALEIDLQLANDKIEALEMDLSARPSISEWRYGARICERLVCQHIPRPYGSVTALEWNTSQHRTPSQNDMAPMMHPPRTCVPGTPPENPVVSVTGLKSHVACVVDAASNTPVPVHSLSHCRP